MQTPAFCLLIIWISTTITYGQQQIYKVFQTKYHHGMVDEGLAIGTKIFQPAYASPGTAVEVYRYASGPWDLQVTIPMPPSMSLNEAFSDSADPKVYAKMIELAGGEEALSRQISKHDELVLKEETAFMYKLNDPLSGNWLLVETNNTKGTKSDPLQRKFYANDKFAFIYKPTEGHSWSMMGHYYITPDVLVETSDYTSNGENVGITVTWAYSIDKDKLTFSGPISATNESGESVLESIFGGGNGKLVWVRE